MTNGEREIAIDDWIHSDVGRKLLKLKLIHGYSFDKAAEEIGYSTRGAKDLYKRLRMELFSHI